MSAESINCPACGAPLRINGPEEFISCDYCGSTIRVRRRNVNADGSTSLTDKATGIAIGTVRLPFGYQAFGMLQPEISSYPYPFGVSASAYNEKGSVIAYFIGEGYTDRSKCPALSGPYSQGLDQISKTHYKDFMDTRQYADNYAATYAAGAKASRLKFVEERPMPLYEPFDEASALENYKRRVEFEKQRSGNAGMAKDIGYYLKGVCYVYDMTLNGVDIKFAITTVLAAWKYHIAGIGGGFGDIGGALNGLFTGSSGGSLGKALFGNSIIGRAIEKNAQPQQQRQNAPQAQTGGFGDMPANSVIEWGSDGLFTLQCLPQEFELAFKGAYTDFCSTFRLDNGIREKMYNMQSQILQNIAQHTQQRIDQMNRQFQSWQQVHATQQAAFDSYNRAWWNRTNSADAARRSAYQSKMAAESSMSDRYSEAIRGVNSYVRPDGTEVEVSVAYDRAYTNNQGDTIGSRSAFEPGGNWTEMNRKR